MGSQLVTQVAALGMAGRLDPAQHAARCCLYVMAATARDTDSATQPGGIYFGGYRYLAAAGLGRAKYDEAARRAVDRCVEQLVDARLIERVGRHGTPGQRQSYTEYRLTLW